jgi:hypothetical protein
LARKFPIVTVTGPRQAGKTTLCRATFPDKRYVSLEAPDVRPNVRPILIYGGAAAQRRSDAEVLPWSAMDGYNWAG